MSAKTLPLSAEKITELANKVGTPFTLYDENAIIENANEFKNSFLWAKEFKNFFAVKALPNINILKIMKNLGFGVDCSSESELRLAELAGFKGSDIMFSSNDTRDDEFALAYKLGAIINLDDITHLDDLIKVTRGKMPETISFRYNPGEKRCGNSIIGNPTQAKYGVPDSEIVNAYKKAKEYGAKHFYLHTMVASNELNINYIVDTTIMLFTLVKRLKDEAGVEIELVDLGGGIGIPYKLSDSKMDLQELGSRIKTEYNRLIKANNLKDIAITFECGRMITGPYGYLVSKVIHVTDKYKKFVGLDACMADLMRPALYGAYHHITLIGDNAENRNKVVCDVTGSLCENNDKFAIDRELPSPQKGDILVIHDTGAHGTAMGFNYNGKLRHKELLLHKDGSVDMIRRDESFYDYISTMLFKPVRID